ncbi:HK97 gp10 family phage protein [Pigmentiphaga kullae]|uniref:Uncharacterized protein n=1 Tax=Pigmentiphaga kullae TaxID=151784 RepID=A0A4Q7NC99_9BURK|nr:HK97 gp10 family phage protein [Pigmentiphaga kullae]RZS80651.1 hypothetical protein EV675_3263 [Pigmentiphaga kullae]
MTSDWQLDGDLMSAIEQLEIGLHDRVAKSAAWAGATVFYGEAQTLAPIYTGPSRQGIKPGQLRDSIYRVHSANLSVNGSQVYEISWNAGKAPHGHLIEYGHWRTNLLVRGRDGLWRATTTQLDVPVWVPPHSFIRRAADAVPRVIEAMQSRSRERVQQLLADLAAGRVVTSSEDSDGS